MLMPPAQLREQGLDVSHVRMPVRDHHRACQSRARPQAGVSQFVDQDEVIGPHQRRNDPKISQIARTKNTGSLGVLQSRQSRFELGK
jgi:hypothetical protein